jgi:hypothetical protein
MTNNPTPTNRISAILDETAPTPSALRAEGALGSAPVTPGGQAGAAREPISDDLLAHLIAPPSDARRQDLLFGQIRDRLIEEYRPTTFTQTATIDLLAHDYVQLIDARAAKEAPQPPPSLFAVTAVAAAAEKRQRLNSIHKNLESISAALEFLGGIKRRCEPEQAEHVADLICRWIKRLEMDVAQTQESPAEYEIPKVKKQHRKLLAMIEECEKQELQELQAEWASLQKSIKKLTDREHLYYFFAGLSPAGRRECGQLEGLLQKMYENQQNLKYFCRIRVTQNDVAQVQEQPTKELILAQRRISDLEKSIDRKLKSLCQK